jgi:hypothetical protein
LCFSHHVLGKGVVTSHPFADTFKHFLTPTYFARLLTRNMLEFATQMHSLKVIATWHMDEYFMDQSINAALIFMFDAEQLNEFPPVAEELDHKSFANLSSAN